MSSNPSYALNDLSDVSTTGAVNGKILKYNGTSWEIADDSTGGGGGSSNFTGLADTPSSLDAGKWLKVNAGATALEWTNAPSDNNTTYDLSAVADSGNAKVRLAGSDSTNDDVTFSAGGGISYAVTGNTVEITSANTLSGLSDTTISGSPTDNYVLTYDSASSKWEPQPVPSGSTPNLNAVLGAGNTSSLAATVGDLTCSNLTVNGTTTTVNSNTVNIGDNILVLNSDETGTPSQNGGLEIERGTSTNVSLRWNETTDKWQYTNDGTTFSDIGSGGITYDLAAAASSGNAKITLSGSNSTTDDIILSAGGGISYAVTSNTIEITSVNSLGGLTDVDISSSPSNGQVLKFNGTKWAPGTDDSGGGADGNNYPTSFSWNSGNGVLTLNRSGLSAITVDLDGRYATGTIPTNNNQLTNGANYVTSSGTITNSEKVRIRTDTGNTMHNIVFVDSYSDNQFQVLKVDNATNSLCYNPSSNRLIGQDLQSFRFTSWAGDYGDSGQFLMSKGSSQWEWSQYVEQKSNGELLLKATGTHEGGHLQFEDMNGSTSYAIDVYRNNSSGHKVLRFIDQSVGLERFSVGPQGQWGIGHVGARDYGSTGEVLISQGPGSAPIWGNHSQISGSSLATADAANNDIDKIYAQLNAIGNDDTITTVAEFKAALLTLVRS